MQGFWTLEFLQQIKESIVTSQMDYLLACSSLLLRTLDLVPCSLTVFIQFEHLSIMFQCWMFALEHFCISLMARYYSKTWLCADFEVTALSPGYSLAPLHSFYFIVSLYSLGSSVCLLDIVKQSHQTKRFQLCLINAIIIRGSAGSLDFYWYLKTL